MLEGLARETRKLMGAEFADLVFSFRGDALCAGFHRRELPYGDGRVAALTSLAWSWRDENLRYNKTPARTPARSGDAIREGRCGHVRCHPQRRRPKSTERAGRARWLRNSGASGMPRRDND
jgi:hypothetical protein